MVNHLGVSRSLAALRFREYQGRTIREVILDTRLEELKKRLMSTQLPAAKIARICGFTDIPHLQTVFKRRFGMPMGKWRHQLSMPDKHLHIPAGPHRKNGCTDPEADTGVQRSTSYRKVALPGSAATSAVKRSRPLATRHGT